MSMQSIPVLAGPVLPASEHAKIFFSDGTWESNDLMRILTSVENKDKLCWFSQDYFRRPAFLFGEWSSKYKEKNDAHLRSMTIRCKPEGDGWNSFSLDAYLRNPESGGFIPRRLSKPVDDARLLTADASHVESLALAGVLKLLADMDVARELVSTAHAHVAYSVCIKLLRLVLDLEKDRCTSEEIANEIRWFLVANGMAPHSTAPELIPICIPDVQDPVAQKGARSTFGNSSEEPILSLWQKEPGDLVIMGDVVNSIGFSKTEIDIVSPCAGRLMGVIKGYQSWVSAGEVVAYIKPE